MQNSTARSAVPPSVVAGGPLSVGGGRRVVVVSLYPPAFPGEARVAGGGSLTRRTARTKKKTFQRGFSEEIA